MDRRHFLALPAAAAMLPGQARAEARQPPSRDVVRYPDPSVRSLDPRWGFDAWASLASPDVYLAERSLAGWKLERVSWRA